MLNLAVFLFYLFAKQKTNTVKVDTFQAKNY